MHVLREEELHDKDTPSLYGNVKRRSPTVIAHHRITTTSEKELHKWKNLVVIERGDCKMQQGVPILCLHEDTGSLIDEEIDHPRLGSEAV